MYAMSVEKGTFYAGIVTLTRKIDLSKLQIFTTQYPNGDNLIEEIFYGDEVLIDNDGGDTTGKSFNAYVMDY